MKTLIELVLESEKNKKEWRNNYKSIEWNNANKLNKELFGITLNQSAGCQCLEDLFFYIKRPNFTKNKTMEKNKKFKIKEGRILQVHGFPPMSNNTTDEVFIRVLKSNNALISAFEVYPSNWKQIVNGAKVAPVKEVDQVEETEAKEDVSNDTNKPMGKQLYEMSVKELQELCEKREIKFHHKSGKEKLISLINA